MLCLSRRKRVPWAWLIGTAVIGTVAVLALVEHLTRKRGDNNLDEAITTEPLETPVPKIPEWKEVEPQDSRYPREHQIQEEIHTAEGVTLIAASRRGKSHAHKGAWREDAFAIQSTNGWQLIAVSDGAGSASLSRLGSEIATRNAVDSLSIRLAEPSDDLDGQLLDSLRNAVVQCRNSIDEQAEQLELKPNELACTLLLFVHRLLNDGSSLVGYLEVGDGAIFVKTAGADDEPANLQILDSEDHGATAGETWFVTSRPADAWSERAKVLKINGGVELVAVATDGVADDFFPYERRAKLLIDAIEQEVFAKPQDDQATALQTLLGYELRGSFDDRTLVVLRREPGVE